MKFNLIICTFQRPEALMQLLRSVSDQYFKPDEVLVIDSSYDQRTEEVIKKKNYSFVKYYKVGDEERGLTRQRNFGISKTSKNIDVICFLDDDTVLETNYFQELMSTYEEFPDAIGVGGYIIEEKLNGRRIQLLLLMNFK